MIVKLIAVVVVIEGVALIGSDIGFGVGSCNDSGSGNVAGCAIGSDRVCRWWK